MEGSTLAELSDAGSDRSGEPTAPFLRILLVEDEAVLRKVIARNLSAQGNIVEEAASAAEAVTKAVESQIDLLLLDINLPDRSGWDVLRELRQLGIVVPTIIVSAVRVSRARLDEFRPMAYLPKPFPLESLLRIAEEVRVRNRPTIRGFVGPQ